jgi:uncharacterized protein YciI
MKYINYATYTSDKTKILALRPQHRQYRAELFKRGSLVAAGPFPDDSGAVFIYEAENDEQAAALVNKDPFSSNGVFQRSELKPWMVVFCNTELLKSAAPQ